MYHFLRGGVRRSDGRFLFVWESKRGAPSPHPEEALFSSPAALCSSEKGRNLDAFEGVPTRPPSPVFNAGAQNCKHADS